MPAESLGQMTQPGFLLIPAVLVAGEGRCLPGRLLHQQRGIDQLSNELALPPATIILE